MRESATIPAAASEAASAHGLAAAQAELESGLLDSIDIPIVVVGPEGHVVRFNHAATGTFDITQADLGRGVGSTRALADLPEMQQWCARVMADGVAARHDIRYGDRTFLLRISPWLQGDVNAGAVLAFTNVTAFRASLNQAVYEREYTKIILNSVVDPLVVLGDCLQVQTANRAFFEWFGVSRDQAQGVPLSALGGDTWMPAGLRASLADLKEGSREFATTEFEGLFPAAGRRTVLLDARRLGAHAEAAIVLVFRDITALKQNERQRESHLAREEALRRQAEAAARDLVVTQDALARRVAELASADRHRNEFLAILAHELRNPLAPLGNAVQILRRSRDPAEAARARDLIDRQVLHMSRLVNDLLEAARVHNGQIRLRTATMDFRTAIEHVVELMRPLLEAKHQALHVELPAVPVWVDGDATRLEQVLTNLLSNANKYTQHRGGIQIRLEHRPDGKWGSALLQVIDNGEGIEAELLPRVFEVFTQADRSLAHSKGGLGIGLSLVRTLVEMHGGRVRVHSAGRGRGSTFEVLMPQVPAPCEDGPSDASCPPAEAGPRRRRVLVVEDNQDARETSCALLGMSGFDVLGFATGTEALQQAAAFAPDAVLLDVGLPGLSGYDVARRLRQIEQFCRTPLIAITGYDTPEARARSAAAGFDHHVCKPVDFDALLKLLG